MIKFEEGTLIKVEIFNTGNMWSMQWEGGGSYRFQGNREDFAKFLMKLKVADNNQLPKSKRSKKYLDIATDIEKGNSRSVWIWKHKLKIMGENHKLVSRRKIMRIEKKNKKQEITVDQRVRFRYEELTHEDGKSSNEAITILVDEIPIPREVLVKMLTRWGYVTGPMERKEQKKDNFEIVEVLEDFRIPGTKIIIEKGEKIEIFPKEKVEKNKKKESFNFMKDVAKEVFRDQDIQKIFNTERDLIKDSFFRNIVELEQKLGSDEKEAAETVIDEILMER